MAQHNHNKRVMVQTLLTVDHVEPGFELVRDAFVENFTSRREVGATFSLFHNGKLVVDLAGGVKDQQTAEEYTGDTLQVVMSCTKVLEGICVAMLVDRGLLDYNQPVCTYWPEFAQNGKDHITLKQLMRHQGGLVGLDQVTTLQEAHDLDALAQRLASQPLFWTPADERSPQVACQIKKNLPVRQAYHCFTRGFYTNELVRRVDGRTMGQFANEEICKPLGIEFYIGLPDSLHNRVATVYGDSLLQQARWLFPQLFAPWLTKHVVHEGDRLDTIELKNTWSFIKSFALAPFRSNDSSGSRCLLSSSAQVFKNFFPLTQGVNNPDFYRLQCPSASGITNARSMARLAALMANHGELDGVRLMSRATFDAAHEVAPAPVHDEVFNRLSSMCAGGWGKGCPSEDVQGCMGMQVKQDNLYFNYMPNLDKSLCGWGGVGGSFMCWNPDLKLGMAYAMNRMGIQFVVDRPAALRDAVAKCLANFPAK